MDEPTNHLDIKSKNVLKQALQSFEGTLILVSHDRDFLQGLTNNVYEFKDGAIKEYLGDIDFYLEQRKVDDFREIEKKDVVVTQKEKKPLVEISYEEQKKIKTLNNKLSSIESKISQLENEIKKIDQELLTNYETTIAKPNFFESYEKKKKMLKDLMSEWEDLTLKMENLA